MNTLYNRLHTITEPLGIWGYGTVGRSAARYCHQHNLKATIFDSGPVNSDDRAILNQWGFTVIDNGKDDPELLKNFLTSHPIIIPSPGVNLALYPNHAGQWLTEIDLFCQAWYSPLIAITGSVGKTTVTHLLSFLLKAHGHNVNIGGNIGIGMLDLLTQRTLTTQTPESPANSAPIAVLELSSFQLEYSNHCAPDLAIITNIVPNHLDRHGTMRNYWNAKAHIFIHQRPTQKLVAPLELSSRITETIGNKPGPSCIYFSSTQPTTQELTYLKPQDSVIYIDQATRIITTAVYTHGALNATREIFSVDNLPKISFIDNWLILCAALLARRITPTQELFNHALELRTAQLEAGPIADPLEHRLERVIVPKNSLEIYNDSKGTTPTSTLAAIKRFTHQPIYLFIGGLSKGVDREPFIQELAAAHNQIKHIFCFGAESVQLGSYCTKYALINSVHQQLEGAVHACIELYNNQDTQEKEISHSVILFSPAGSSYDLFKDYQERGTVFKRLMHEQFLK